MLSRRSLHRPGRSSQIGFTLIELAIVMVVAGLLLVPLLRMAGSAVVSTRLKKTQSILETASEALIAFAAANGGCLPFAADYEGGLPDTDASGTASATPDTGNGVVDQHAGDLPWADLGLTNSFLDGDGLRIQYYVATPYTDSNETTPVLQCDAGFRGFPYDEDVEYTAPDDGPLWLYATPTSGPTSGILTLYQLPATMVLEISAPDAENTPYLDADVATPPHADPLPNPLLQVLKGPDITVEDDPFDDDTDNLQNVFVLIAAGPNRNAEIDRLFSRDSVHKGTSAGATWALSTLDVDDIVFSSEPDTDTTDTANSGDDTLLNMPFNDFKTEMRKYGLNMEAVCENVNSC